MHYGVLTRTVRRGRARHIRFRNIPREDDQIPLPIRRPVEHDRRSPRTCDSLVAAGGRRLAVGAGHAWNDNFVYFAAPMVTRVGCPKWRTRRRARRVGREDDGHVMPCLDAGRGHGAGGEEEGEEGGYYRVWLHLGSGGITSLVILVSGYQEQHRVLMTPRQHKHGRKLLL